MKNIKAFLLKHKIFIVGSLIFLLILSTWCFYYFTKHEYLSEQRNFYNRIPNELKGERVILKKLKEEFFMDYHNMLSLDVRHSLEFPEDINLNWTLHRLGSYMKDMKNGKAVHYCIFDTNPKEQKLIGALNIRECTNNGQFGCWLHENHRGGGRIQESISLITKAYFSLKNTTKFIAHVRLWNQRSYKALLRAGFQDHGKLHLENKKPSSYILEYYKK